MKGEERRVAGGAKADVVASRVRELKVTPEERVTKKGETYKLRVAAAFADGTTEDVTPYC